MIWFFIAGFIAGAVGTVMFLHWWMQNHIVKVTPEQAMRELKHMQNMKEEKKDD